MKTKNNDHEECTEHCDHEHEGDVLSINKAIYVIGEINPSTVGNFLVGLEQADALPGLITVNICSMGGWVEGGFAMYDAIKATQNPVLTVGHGAVYSCAILPFQAGDYREMQRNSRMFFHPMSLSLGQSNLKSMNIVANETKKLYDLYCEVVSKSSGMKPAKVAGLCESETYLSSNECLKMGLCDHVQKNNKKPVL
jgi:ATP-dependent protease ClpP protease subunit